MKLDPVPSVIGAERAELSAGTRAGQPMNPRLGFAKRPRLGRTVERLPALTPNQVARVALYSSTLVVGIQRPRPVS